MQRRLHAALVVPTPCFIPSKPTSLHKTRFSSKNGRPCISKTKHLVIKKQYEHPRLTFVTPSGKNKQENASPKHALLRVAWQPNNCVLPSYTCPLPVKPTKKMTTRSMLGSYTRIYPADGRHLVVQKLTKTTAPGEQSKPQFSKTPCIVEADVASF